VRFLADESCDHRVVIALRHAGHDVAAVAEVARGASDADVIERATREGRVLLTEDRDFGQLVHAAGGDGGSGVLYVRCPELVRPRLPALISSAVERAGRRLEGSFTVWTPHRLRIRRKGEVT
jgi:predicted nuclease of predicted toxin-antitoxin system